MTPSLETIPTKIRLAVIDQLVPAGPIHRAWLSDDILKPNTHIESTSTKYSKLLVKQPQRNWKHGLLYIDRKINGEYTKELYKRIKFFIYVDERNLFSEYFWPLLNLRYSGGIHHIRRCIIYFDVATITDETNFIIALRKTQQQLTALKGLLLEHGFDKLQELRVYVNLPGKLSLSVPRLSSEKIKAAQLRDMKLLPKLTELWLDPPGYHDRKFKLVDGQ